MAVLQGHIVEHAGFEVKFGSSGPHALKQDN